MTNISDSAKNRKLPFQPTRTRPAAGFSTSAKLSARERYFLKESENHTRIIGDLSDSKLANMSYKLVLTWAWSDRRQRFIRERLQRIAATRDFKPGWVHYTMRLTLGDALWRRDAYARFLTDEQFLTERNSHE
jgi:hypothetical protein